MKIESRRTNGCSPKPEFGKNHWSENDYSDELLESRFHDVYYTDLVREPIETVRRLYARLGLAWSEEVETRMRRFLAEHQQDGNGVHRYSLAQFGLTPEIIADRFHHYYRRFKLTPNCNGGDPRHEDRPEPTAHG